MRGSLDEARPLLEEALDRSLAARSTSFVTLCLAGYAQLAFADGDPGRAALLEGAAEGLRRRVGLSAWPHLRKLEAELVAHVRQRLGAARFDQAFSAGSGLLLALPALEATGLLEAARGVYGRLRDGFYGLTATLLTLVFLELAGEPRAEDATRVPPAALGRVLGLDRAPEVKTIRRKLAELAAAGKAAELIMALARRHAATRPGALGFLYIDGHARLARAGLGRSGSACRAHRAPYALPRRTGRDHGVRSSRLSPETVPHQCLYICAPVPGLPGVGADLG